MTSTLNRKTYTETSKSKSSVVEDSKKKASLLKDNSWIKKDVTDDKAVEQNSNYGRSVLSRFKSTENISSTTEINTSSTSSSKVTETGSSKKYVQSLTKRFSVSQDELDSSRFTASVEPKTSTTTTSFKNGTKTSVTTSRTPTKTETFTEKIFTDSKTNIGGDKKTFKPAPPISPTKTTKRETVTVTTSKDNTVQEDNKTVKVVTTPTSPTKSAKTETVTVTTFKDTIVQEDSKTAKSAPPFSPTKSSKTETVTVTTFKDTIVQEDSKSVRSALPTSPTKSITSTSYKSTTPTSKTTSYTFSSTPSAEDQLFDTLIPTSIKSAQVSDPSSVTSSTTYARRSYKDSKPEEYFSETVLTESVKTVSSASESYGYGSQRGSSKTYSTTTYTENRPEDYSDIYKSRTVETVYTSPERKIADRDLCTYCQKPMLSDTKMILEDVDIKCHASCFKCDVCKSPLGHLKAGDSMWVYRRNVHCEACFGITKGKWQR
ncbi:sciellin isoform X1 [Ictalurus furcatus]|uniref:sciellin isoform X1 n=1 Tax=Ictalurus furcatus TaxID=66913 RepID=UPI00235041F5|nr:sciellin isoform X1 [Ictalurus furcatus]